MRDPFLDLGEMICETLTYCYEPSRERPVENNGKEMNGSFEQIVAAAVSHSEFRRTSRCGTGPHRTPKQVANLKTIDAVYIGTSPVRQVWSGSLEILFGRANHSHTANDFGITNHADNTLFFFVPEIVTPYTLQ